MLSEIADLDAQCDGVLIHSENFQALGLMQEKYKEQVKCIYIDPPYNTNASEIVYKNGYKHSSWCSLIENRVKFADELLNNQGFHITAIDHAECFNLGKIQDSIYGDERRLAIVTVQHNPKGRNQSKFFSENTEYLFFYAKDPRGSSFRQVAISEEVANSFEFEDGIGKFRYENYIRARTVWARKNKPNNWYPLYVSKDLNTISSVYKDDFYEVYPRTKQGDFSWKNIRDSFDELNKLDNFLAKYEDGQVVIYHKYREQQVLKNIWVDKKYQSEFNGTNILKDVIGENLFDYPKSVYAVLDVIKITSEKNDFILDYFSGSGTTAHSVISLNREDGGKRKYILVEQNNYFDTVLKPRIQKVVYSKDWKEGKPVSREGISHCFKYLRLESYEDVLNNLVFKQDPARDQAIANNPELRRDYVLNYFLDVETQGSQSLLNIADFRDPTAYKMYIKKPGSESQMLQSIDLIETFNWLIGLWVQNMAAPQQFSAEFSREIDPDLPTDHNTRLLCTRLKPVVDSSSTSQDADHYWFRLIEGYTLKTPGDDSSKLPTLIVWRKLTDDSEKDNAVLQKYLIDKMQISPREQTYAVIYVNGSHTLPKPVVEGEQTKVRLIEEAFHTAMWSGA